MNNFVPHDIVAAYAMASYLTSEKQFDRYIAVAPEGYIYGFFFSVLGHEHIDVHVDFPPTTCRALADLSVIHAQHILVIEDDIIGGSTLQLVINELAAYSPKTISLYLGHHKCYQHLENVPKGISTVYIAEDTLKYQADYASYERELYAFFARYFREKST